MEPHPSTDHRQSSCAGIPVLHRGFGHPAGVSRRSLRDLLNHRQRRRRCCVPASAHLVSRRSLRDLLNHRQRSEPKREHGQPGPRRQPDSQPACGAHRGCQPAHRTATKAPKIDSPGERQTLGSRVADVPTQSRGFETVAARPPQPPAEKRTQARTLSAGPAGNPMASPGERQTLGCRVADVLTKGFRDGRCATSSTTVMRTQPRRPRSQGRAAAMSQLAPAVSSRGCKPVAGREG